jgi:hypothetical protein
MNNIILIILLVILLFVYAILFNIKNKQTKNIIESFSDVQKSIFKESLKKLNSNDEAIYLSRMNAFILGNWTTDKSEVSGNKVKNIMEIKEDIELNNKNIIIFNETYPINFIGEGVIITEKINGTSIIINFINFTNKNNLNQPFNTIEGLPRGIINFSGKINKRYLTYKLLNGITLTDKQNELKRIIENKIFNINPPPLKYDITTYKIMINNYKYPENMINFTTNTIPYKEIEKWRIDKIKKVYNNSFKISIKRTYQGINNERLTTQMSQKYDLVPLDENGLKNQITIKKAEEELLLNRITNSFQLVETEVYYYYINNSTQKYVYNDKNLLYSSASNMNLIGNLENSFSNDISYPDLDSLMNKGENYYKPYKFTFKTPDINKEYTFTLWNQNLVV